MRPKARADAAGSSERQSFSRLGVASRRCIRRSDRHHLSPQCQRRDGTGRVQPSQGKKCVSPAHGGRAVPGFGPRPMSPDVGVVLLTGNGPSSKDGGWAFCSGGDQRIRGRSGYQYASGETAETVDVARAGRLHILEVQRLIRFMPKVMICLVNGWAAGGGHSLHSTCDLTLASREHARFKQTDADVGSFDGSYGSAYLARQVGQKFAREIFFLGRAYTAEQMHRMGAVNEVVDHAALESVGVQWAAEINAKSPQAQRMLKYAFNLLDDGLVGQQLFAGEASRLAYMTDEAVEGRDAFLEKRDPDYGRFPRHFSLPVSNFRRPARSSHHLLAVGEVRRPFFDERRHAFRLVVG